MEPESRTLNRKCLITPATQRAGVLPEVYCSKLKFRRVALEQPRLKRKRELRAVLFGPSPVSDGFLFCFFFLIFFFLVCVLL